MIDVCGSPDLVFGRVEMDIVAQWACSGKKIRMACLTRFHSIRPGYLARMA